MTQKSWKKFWGDTQESVGKFDALFSLISNIAVGIIMIIAGILIIHEGSKNDKLKTVAYVVGGSFIVLSLIAIFASYYWNKAVRNNRTLAQVGGFMFEGRILNNLLNSGKS
jgi:surface polysaccharide O-acyltransferase-like enzyme